MWCIEVEGGLHCKIILVSFLFIYSKYAFLEKLPYFLTYPRNNAESKTMLQRRNGNDLTRT